MESSEEFLISQTFVLIRFSEAFSSGDVLFSCCLVAWAFAYSHLKSTYSKIVFSAMFEYDHWTESPSRWLLVVALHKVTVCSWQQQKQKKSPCIYLSVTFFEITFTCYHTLRNQVVFLFCNKAPNGSQTWSTIGWLPLLLGYGSTVCLCNTDCSITLRD